MGRKRKNTLFLVFLEIGNNQGTDYMLIYSCYYYRRSLVAHQQLGFVVLQFSLKVHHLLLGISQVHFGIVNSGQNYVIVKILVLIE